jgi:uncharacterized LabA/DUF88 family protein
VPDIHANSPALISYSIEGVSKKLSVTVSLAYSPVGSYVALDETLVKERNIRKFYSRAVISSCANSTSCGLRPNGGLTHSTSCTVVGCGTTLGEILVRDEQKMVDTMLVADIAQIALVNKATDIVLVSSDTDMWPGVLLALQNGCSVAHIHTKKGWRTQRHLINTIPRYHLRNYMQLSV